MKNGKHKPKQKGERSSRWGFKLKPIVLKFDWAHREKECLDMMAEMQMFRSTCGNGKRFVSTYTGGGGFRMAPRYQDGRPESMLV